MSGTFQLNPDEHDRIYADIEKDSFQGTSPVERPRIIITGGQPGSGKSKLIGLSKEEFPDGNVVVINGDELRDYHPHAEKILRLDDKKFAEHTDPDSRNWTRELFDRAIEEKRNIIFESTMRESGPLSKTLVRLRECGYKITAKVVACHERQSTTGIGLTMKDEERRMENLDEKLVQVMCADATSVYKRLKSKVEKDGKAPGSFGVLMYNDCQAFLSFNLQAIGPKSLGKIPLGGNPVHWEVVRFEGDVFEAADEIQRIWDDFEGSEDESDDGWAKTQLKIFNSIFAGLKKFDEEGGFESDKPRTERALLLWIHDPDHPEWLDAWQKELNPPETHAQLDEDFPYKLPTKPTEYPKGWRGWGAILKDAEKKDRQ